MRYPKSSPIPTARTEIAATSGLNTGTSGTPPKYTQSMNGAPIGANPSSPTTQVAAARNTSGIVIDRGDSCRCSVPRYSPWKVLSTIRVV